MKNFIQDHPHYGEILEVIKNEALDAWKNESRSFEHEVESGDRFAISFSMEMGRDELLRIANFDIRCTSDNRKWCFSRLLKELKSEVF